MTGPRAEDVIDAMEAGYNHIRQLFNNAPDPFVAARKLMDEMAEARKEIESAEKEQAEQLKARILFTEGSHKRNRRLFDNREMQG